MTQRIIPTFWFNGNAEEAAQFYEDVFPCASYMVPQRYPETGLPDFQQPLAGQPVVVSLDVDGYQVTLLNAGSEFSPNASISLMVYFSPKKFQTPEGARGAIDEVWRKLSGGGHIVMPLDEYSWSSRFGWVNDKYGVSWQLFLAEDDDVEFIGPSLMFGGRSQGKCTEAMAYYASVFPESADGQVFRYGDVAEGIATPEHVMWAENTLWSQQVQYCDATDENAPVFSEGVSLDVRCDTQEEIDRLWEALSAVPEAEQCGWCKDMYGVSWQINVANIEQLMNGKPDSWAKLMGMKKIVIDEL